MTIMKTNNKREDDQKNDEQSNDENQEQGEHTFFL